MMKRIWQGLEEEKEKEIKEIFDYIKDELDDELDENRIKKLYELIPNPEKRVNSDDKQWIAFVTQKKEVDDAIDAIEKIVLKNIENAVDEVGKLFVKKNINKKPRIVFYILALDKIVK